LFSITPPNIVLGSTKLRFGERILVRKLLKRASFKSKDDLKTRILDFIGYFNKTMAKPFKWTYKGKVLAI
jgi:V8-like Glu-specific endopeptidase